MKFLLTGASGFIGSKIDWNGQVEWNQKSKRPGEIFCLNSNHNLITQTTGWSPKVSPDKGINLTIERWQK
jgi:nucleoside-diphosphate-sugar epimerase